MTAPRALVRHVDLAGRDCTVAAADCPVLLVLWWRELPLGTMVFRPEELPCNAARLRTLAADLVTQQVAARSRRLGPPLGATGDGHPRQLVSLDAAQAADGLLAELDAASTLPLPDARSLSVVVCTRDRPDSLALCLASLGAQRRPPGEVVVVDNSRTRSAEAICEGFPGIRYVHAPRPGLSVARNVGLRAARGELVAFTDDDVEVHPAWTGALVAAFARADVEAVTGMVLPARLDTEAQVAFELHMGGFTQASIPLAFDRDFFEDTRATAAQVWRIGAGANMAFRRAVFDRVGLFDERLGAGAAGCSEDSELWYRILATGGTCLYEPRAVVYHHHRAEWQALRRQVRFYLKGHVAALVVQSDRFGHTANIRRALVQLPLHFLRTARTAVKSGPRQRLAILGDELVGWCAGLRYLLDWRWRRGTERWDGRERLPRADQDPRHA